LFYYISILLHNLLYFYTLHILLYFDITNEWLQMFILLLQYIYWRIHLFLYFQKVSKSNNFQSEIQKIVQSASCIIILYDSSRDESYNNLLQVWLPTIQATLSSDSNCKKPIIAVGSKIDLLVNDNNTNNNYKMKDKKGNEILKKFKFVTNCCR